MARPSSTAAIPQAASKSGTQLSRSVRRIDNGYVLCESTFNPDTGAYRHSETFSEKEPSLDGSSPRGSRPDGPGDLRETIAYLKGTTLGSEKS